MERRGVGFSDGPAIDTKKAMCGVAETAGRRCGRRGTGACEAFIEGVGDGDGEQGNIS